MMAHSDEGSKTWIEKVTWASVLLFVLVTILAVGCRPDFPKCRDADDCAAEEGNTTLMACCNGQCQECCADGDCKDKERPRCKENRCVQCIEDKDCPEDKPFCEEEKCVYECEIDADCVRRNKAGMICKEHKCQWECEKDEDCNDPNKECKDHHCVIKCKCQTDEDCPEGKMCRDCECIDKPQCELETIHFDFDRYDLRSGDREILDRNVECMKQRTDITVTIEGNCDERGTTEYNIGLGDKRAKAARRYMENLGIDRSRLKTISYGEERPVCNESTEDCWGQNRRSEFKY
ncbi:MAG: peptidoglycan-associated lipoprotein Pal [Deltaproteobacteria bacterium]|nr:peptidoglycan-associated lipoprotein Pal [Deltaproteobacteria bacterium]